jgi:hypothetical protein
MAKIDMFYDGKARPKFDSSMRSVVKNQLRTVAKIHQDDNEEDLDEDDEYEIETFQKIPVKKK